MKIDRIYIAGYKGDLHFTQCCVASIRHWYPHIPITLLKDESAGAYSTEQVERLWNVSSFNGEQKIFGQGMSKLEPLFLTNRERCLILDSDIVFVGKLLDVLENHDDDFIVADTQNPPEEVPIHYFNIDKLRELDPDFTFPNFTFNSGQIVATTGILKRADFEPVISFSQPPTRRYPDIFAPGEQGILNYILFKKLQEGKISFRRVPFMWWAGWLDEKTVKVERLTKHSPYPFLVHWAGPKQNASFDTIRNGHLLRHFESYYRSRTANSGVNERIRPMRRIARLLAALLNKRGETRA